MILSELELHNIANPPNTYARPPLNFHIYRISKVGSEASHKVRIFTKPCPISTYTNEIIASFKTEDLRDIAYAGFVAHIRANRHLYPHHTVEADYLASEGEQ